MHTPGNLGVPNVLETAIALVESLQLVLTRSLSEFIRLGHVSQARKTVQLA